MKRYFSDDILQKKFETDGYVKVNLLDTKEIGLLKNVYKKSSSVFYPIKGLTANVHKRSTRVNLYIDREIGKIMEAAVQKYLTGCNLLGSIFISKTNYKINNKLSLHQDWSITNEQNGEFEILIWAPLQDVSEENGCLVVLPGSHRLFNNTVRSYDFPSIYVDYEHPVIRKHAVSLPLQTGQAIIYTAHLFHGSFPNTTKENRVAVASTFVPENAELGFYMKDKLQNSYHKYEYTKDFHIRHIHRLYKNKLDLSRFANLQSFPGLPEELTEEKFLAKIDTLG